MNRFWKFLRGPAFTMLLAPLCLWLAGCESTGDDTGGSAVVKAGAQLTPGADVLRPGDHIRIVYNDIPKEIEPAPADLQIPDDGKLMLHMGVEVNFANKRRTDVEREIEHEYTEVRKLYKKITITIERMGLFVSVGGYVKTPMSVTYSGDMTVVKAVNAAGGVTEFAAKRRVVLRRSNGQKVIINLHKAEVDAKFDQPVFPGDSIYVPKGNI